jgi:hypothetical protein
MTFLVLRSPAVAGCEGVCVEDILSEIYSVAIISISERFRRVIFFFPKLLSPSKGRRMVSGK